MRVVLGRHQRLPVPAVVMCDTRLQLLGARDGGSLEVGNHIDNRDTIESDHLLEIDKPAFIAVHVLDRRTEVRAIPVRLENVAPVRSWRLGGGHVEEKGISARFEDGVCLFIKGWRSKRGAKVERVKSSHAVPGASEGGTGR